MGFIGDNPTEIEFEPLTAPVVPEPIYAPVAPVETPAAEPVPA